MKSVVLFQKENNILQLRLLCDFLKSACCDCDGSDFLKKALYVRLDLAGRGADGRTVPRIAPTSIDHLSYLALGDTKDTVTPSVVLAGDLGRAGPGGLRICFSTLFCPARNSPQILQSEASHSGDECTLLILISKSQNDSVQFTFHSNQTEN